MIIEVIAWLYIVVAWLLQGLRMDLCCIFVHVTFCVTFVQTSNITFSLTAHLSEYSSENEWSNFTELSFTNNILSAISLETMNDVFCIYSYNYFYLVDNICNKLLTSTSTFEYKDNDTDSFNSILNALNRQRPTTVFVIGETSLHIRALTTGNTIDNVFGQQGYFTHVYKWILIITKKSELKDLEMYVGVIQHVTAIVPSNNLQSGDIYSAMWKLEGRIFEKIGEVTLHSGLILYNADDSIFPNIKYGFNGQQLKVVTQFWPVFVLEEKDIVRNVTNYKGSFMELLKILSSHLNFTYEIIIPTGGHWGGESNGTWNGIVGYLQMKQADISVAPLASSVNRAKVMDFADIPVVVDWLVVIYRKPEPMQNTLLLYLKPFQLQVWLVITLSYLVINLVLLFPQTVLREKEISLIYRKTTLRNIWRDLKDIMWKTFASFFYQCINAKPSNCSTCIFIAVWILYSLLVTLVWSANIIAFTAIKLYPDKLNDLSQLSNNKQKVVGTLSSSSAVEYLQNSKDKVLSRLWSKMEEDYHEDPSVLSNDHSAQIKNVIASSDYAYIMDLITLSGEVEKHNCTLTIVPEYILPFRYFLGMQHNSAFRDIFTRASIEIIEFGLYEYWSRNYTGHTSNSKCNDNIVNNQALSLYHFQSVLICVGAMLCLSIIIFVIEIFLFQFQRI